MIVQKQIHYRLQAAKKKGLIRQRNTKENTIVNTKRSSRNHTCVEFVEKLFPTALISEDMKSLKDAHKQKPTMFSEISSY